MAVTVFCFRSEAGSDMMKLTAVEMVRRAALAGGPEAPDQVTGRKGPVRANIPARHSTTPRAYSMILWDLYVKK